MSMKDATAVHKRVLKALQNQAADSQKLLTTQRASGTEPTPEWTQDFQARAMLHSELGAAAIAGGVPVEWVDQARERGTKGIHWNTNLFLRRAAPVDREALIGNLRTDIDRLARHTGIHAAYRPLAAAHNSDTGSVDETLNTLWRRSAQVGVLLGVEADEARQWWPQDTWIETAASAAAGLTEAGLAHQWRAIAATDISSCAVQARALAEAGIDPDSRIAPPEPSAVLDVLGDNHVRVVGLFSHGPGAQIDAAIEATGASAHHLDNDGWTTQPVFSDPQTNYPGIEP
ncbi:hypothetical protein NN3_00620 [Nocardia neocaledoniensis NBRC 108232]|uniref:Uncharacterized protein n=1 Tax=Nocardia neocaledoniensis TaxID=236511 RepID=A0A317NGY0_9NOCA|nr:hypothetical protein [Nocardia neocaledoniensis]PWV74449.1 hypothetical protein DFR69_106260 [Nocardia neocaledoniensis]GEM29055.1 hypothetical protein NN3_00620 [Nocardia neocaledoniensis NBRC 108232]